MGLGVRARTVVPVQPVVMVPADSLLAPFLPAVMLRQMQSVVRRVVTDAAAAAVAAAVVVITVATATVATAAVAAAVRQAARAVKVAVAAADHSPCGSINAPTLTCPTA